MGEKLIMSEEVEDLVRRSGEQDRALRSPDRMEIPCGLQGEEVGAEHLRHARTHSSGAREARIVEQF